ncbi:MAG: hypothetical protein ACRDKU_07170, partial [Gaiellaceae bacterium]
LDDLAQVIAALQKAIRDELKAAREEEAEVKRLTARIAAERRKEKPNRSLIDKWERQRERHETFARRHRETAGDLSSQANDWTRTMADERRNFGVIGFERRDVELDVMDLQSERREVAGTTLPTRPPGAAPGEAPGAPPDQSEELRRALEELGKLRLAFGIQQLQTGIIGAYQRGTLHVPETGLALVHAGEGITPAGVPAAATAASVDGRPLAVTVVLEGDAAGLERFVKVKAVEVSDEINLQQSRDFDFRRRAGVLS